MMDRMFSLSFTAEAPVAGTIRVKKPIRALGNHTDVDGTVWNVGAVFGKYVCACPLNELHPYYRDTSTRSFGLVQQKWQPYLIEIV